MKNSAPPPSRPGLLAPRPFPPELLEARWTKDMSPGQEDTYRKDRAKEFWAYVIPQLVRLKRFDECDEAAVTQMCLAYGSLRLTGALIARNGQVVMMPSKTGFYPQTNPAVGQWNMYSKAFERSLKQFGLYPAVRKRLRPEPLDSEPTKGKGPDLDTFLSKYDETTEAEQKRAAKPKAAPAKKPTRKKR